MGIPPGSEKNNGTRRKRDKAASRGDEVVNLGTSEEKKEVKIETCVSANIQDELVALLQDYQDIFAWSY